MKVLSLFDGISCARVSLECADIYIEQYFASEIDKYAQQISAKNFPDIIQIGDVKMVAHKDAPIHYKLNNIDLLIGGSPCQDLSIAKKNRKGLDGERSGLFWEYVRILREVKPQYFILENVASMTKEAKQIITETLGVEPVMINAALVSAQNRKRLFWVGRLSGNKYKQVEVPHPEDKGILLKDILEPKVAEHFYVKPKSNTVRSSGRGSGIDDKHNWGTIRIGSIGKGGQGDRIYSPNGKSVGLSALGGGRGAKTGLYAVALRNRGQGKKPEIGNDKANAMTTVQTDSMVGIIQRPRGFNKGGFHKEKSPTLSVNSWQGNNKLQLGMNIRKLTPIECERLQCLPDNYTEGISNTQRYKTLGNAFNIDVVAHILKYIK